MRMPFDGHVETGPAVSVVVPDPPVERQLETLGAAGGLDRTTVVAERPSDRSDETRESGSGNHDHGVRTGEPHIEGAAVVPVGDPAICVEQPGLQPVPFVPLGLDPARLPEVLVEVDDRKPSDLSQRVRERGLPGSSRTDDRDAPHATESGGRGGDVGR